MPPRSGTRQMLAPSCSCCGHHRPPSRGARGLRYVSLTMSVSCASKDLANNPPNSGSAPKTLPALASRIAATVPRENDMERQLSATVMDKRCQTGAGLLQMKARKQPHELPIRHSARLHLLTLKRRRFQNEHRGSKVTARSRAENTHESGDRRDPRHLGRAQSSSGGSVRAVP